MFEGSQNALSITSGYNKSSFGEAKKQGPTTTSGFLEYCVDL